MAGKTVYKPAAKLDPRVREPNRRLSVEQNQCVPATGNFPLSCFFFPRGTLSSSTSIHTVTNPLHPRVSFSCDHTLVFSLHLSFRSLLQGLRIYKRGWSCAHPPALQSRCVHVIWFLLSLTNKLRYFFFFFFLSRFSP